MSNGNPYVAIYESGEEIIISKEAREITQTDDYIKNRIALAIVIKNLAHRIITNFFIRINKKDTIIKAFTSREEAIKWAKSYL